jgi:hypothetical protein
LKYRAGIPPHWSDAITVNLSRTGVLLWPSSGVPPGDRVEMILTLPLCDAFPSARILCAALVVRTDADGMAVEIERYRILKPGEDDHREGL